MHVDLHTFEAPGPWPLRCAERRVGRWLTLDNQPGTYNESLRLRERRRAFNVPELNRLVALSVQQREDDVTGFEKLAEGGFNRCFLVTMRNGMRVVARIPYPVTEPKSLVIASEVATTDFLRSHGIPVPKIFGYSTTDSNSAGTEYIFMEFVQGTNLGDVWFTLTERQRTKLTTSLVQLESQIFALRFPASGSIYYCHDLPKENRRVMLPSHHSNNDTKKGDNFCIGPATSLEMWFGRRNMLSVDRGPHGDCPSALTAGAKKEIAEAYDYKPQSHREHITTLENYLQIAPHLIPHKVPELHRPVIRHPDLQPNNIFVSDDLEICGLIDWQHSTVLPLFLQCGIPKSLQNYGDAISESLQTPSLPDNFDELEEMEQYRQADIYRRRQLHHVYFELTSKMNSEHYEALTDYLNTVRRRLFYHASEPWEGDNVTLKADLVTLSKKWRELDCEKTAPCPLQYSDEESLECLRMEQEQSEADEQLQAAQEVIGVGSEGWVPVGQYDHARGCERKLKAAALEVAETDEDKAIVQANWIFDDFSEEDYM
ncbi:hypothetical protein N7466_007173 [Penicillium verhagenii]|uniref:uncharacterized protein n=1 Tax=Penicillium verhagenii TaxID=1562060 RepID=UPI002544F69F|nr:uncharacterized protein N7466_007173 [Penicillium verhagenii]KAJ5928217.1 hypothetical protein N7466_007173 [Penicillium verhagenii]